MTHLPRRAALALLAGTLAAACGGGPRERVSQATAPVPLQVRPPRFGDAKPVVWPGRPPSAYPVHGIDVSRYQLDIDWVAARDAGVSFAFVKATEGGDRVDPYFERNWREARRAGVPVGAYHFYYHCREPEEQARWFIRHVPRERGALPPVLDIEWTPFSPTCTIRPPAAEVRDKAERYLRIVERHYGQPALIYSAPDFWTDNEMWRLPGNHEFWLRSVTRHPSERYGGQHWTFWQYTGTGLVPGIPTQTDINVFAGSAAEFRAWLARRTA
jgi:lysozyme